MNNELEREIRRLSNLKQNKDVPEESLEPIAKNNLIVRNFKSEKIFSDEDEQKIAEQKFKDYIDNYKIESQSDIDTLSSLVYVEVFERRIQKELNKLQDQGKYPPDRLTKQLTELQDQKLTLKVKLGIDKKEDEKDDLSALQLLQKRTEKYIQEHRNEFTLNIPWICEECGHEDIESYLIYRRVEDFKALKHPWFAGRYLFNLPLIKLVKEKKITKEEAMGVLVGTGMGGDYNSDDKKYCADYIDYLLEHYIEITDLLRKQT